MGDIADEHYSQMMWEHGNPYLMETQPFADHPAFGGWRAYLLRHAQDPDWMREESLRAVQRSGHRLEFTFPCRFCGNGITFINRKPFDANGPHRCLAAAGGRG